MNSTRTSVLAAPECSSVGYNAVDSCGDIGTGGARRMRFSVPRFGSGRAPHDRSPSVAEPERIRSLHVMRWPDARASTPQGPEPEVVDGREFGQEDGAPPTLAERRSVMLRHLRDMVALVTLFDFYPTYSTHPYSTTDYITSTRHISSVLSTLGVPHDGSSSRSARHTVCPSSMSSAYRKSAFCVSHCTMTRFL